MKKLFNLIIIIFLVWWFANWASIYFSPENWVFTQDCSFNLDIIIDTKWYEISTVWVAILNNDGYQILDFKYNSWVFASYTSMIKWVSKQKNFKWKEYVYIMWTNGWGNKFNWIWKFASVKIKPNNFIKDLAIKFYAIPNFWGDDSNIVYYSWWKSIDILNSFTGWNYKFINWECYDNDKISKITSETKLNKNPNIDESKYSHWLNTSNVDKIITAQNSKFLFWLSEHRNIVILIWVLLFSFWIVIRRRMRKNLN